MCAFICFLYCYFCAIQRGKQHCSLLFFGRVVETPGFAELSPDEDHATNFYKPRNYVEISAAHSIHGCKCLGIASPRHIPYICCLVCAFICFLYCYFCAIQRGKQHCSLLFFGRVVETPGFAELSPDEDHATKFYKPRNYVEISAAHSIHGCKCLGIAISPKQQYRECIVGLGRVSTPHNVHMPHVPSLSCLPSFLYHPYIPPIFKFGFFIYVFWKGEYGFTEEKRL